MFLANKILRYVLIFLVLTVSVFPVTVAVRAYDHPGYTRVVFQGNETYKFSYSQSELKNDLIFEVRAGTEFVSKRLKSKLISEMVPLKEEGRVVLKFSSSVRLKSSFVLEKPFRVVFDIVKIKTPVIKEEPAESETEVKQPTEGETQKPVEAVKDMPVPQQSAVTDKDGVSEKAPEKRAVIEAICIDAGHGGADLGAVGATGVSEKDITLKVSRRLKSIVEEKLGLRVIVTRDSDKEVSLNRRAAIANNQKAQLFISIHVNSSFRTSVRGPETFYVSLKATDREAYELARKENQEGDELQQPESSMSEPGNDDLKMILWNMAQTEHVKESSKLAEFVQFELNALMNTRNRGVKQAPFRVLMRTAMPAVLVEVAFLSNKDDEALLSEAMFTDRVASAIYNGLRKFINYYNSLN